MKLTRRSVLKASGVGVGAALAGCVDGPGDNSGDDTSGEGDALSSSYAAFFALSDWITHITGDELSVETAVSVGQAGHGWEPPSDLPFDVAESDVFVYVDSPEFTWAQNVAEQVESEGVETIDVMEGIPSGDLLDWDHEHGHDHGDENGEDHDGDDHDEDHDGDDHDGEQDDHDGEHDDEHDDEHDGDDHDGEHGNDEDDNGEGASEFHDPHVWVDPVLAQEMVEYIAEEFGHLDPDNEEYYRENAEEYVEELESVHQEFQTLSENASNDVAIFAGHVSYQYAEERYGFRLHSPQGISPDAEPSQDEIAETIEMVEDNGIDTVLYDPFDSSEGSPPPLAQRLLDSTDASEARPVTPLAGTTAEWQDEEWGWVEQMEEVNIPAFRAALDPE